MNDHGIAYMAYVTHDPDEVVQNYIDKAGQEPTIILIRPEFPVTKDHPLIMETKFCGHNMMMVSGDIDVIGYRNILTIKERQRQKRKILDGKLLRQLRTRERKLEESLNDDTTYFTPDDEEREKKKLTPEELGIKFVSHRKVMTDEEYLRYMEKPGYVYLMSSDNGYQKIGRSIDVEDRRSQLEREIPVVIRVIHYFASRHYIEAELFMHEKFSEFRTGRYEWFKLGEKQIKAIRRIRDYDLDQRLEKLVIKHR